MNISLPPTRPRIRQPRLHSMVFEAIDRTQLTHRHIAKTMGLSNSNIISMWKHGDNAIPVERVYVLAAVLGLDPGKTLLTAVFETYPLIARQLADEGLLTELPTAVPE